MYVSDIKHPTQSLEEKLHHIYTLNRDKKIDLSFRPQYLNLLKKLNNPHLNLPPTIHIAGTNGKGSTIAIMRAILESAGYKVHAYTSPHLCKFNERIYLAGKNISDETLENLIDEALKLNANKDLTFFEITTAIAFTAFSRVPADILLLETGMGGRLDCTNVIESPLVTIITSISYDHMEYLGNTLPEIASEKAGVIKTNTPCVIGAQNKDSIDENVINVFKSKALELDAPLLCYGADWFIMRQKNQICFSFEEEEMILPLPNIIGSHQIENAGTALTALETIKAHFNISKQDYANGIKNVSWPARLQKIMHGSLITNLPNTWEIWLDGGHNKNATQAIAKQVQHWSENDSKPLHLVIGMMNHKDPVSFIEPLLHHVNSITTINIPDEPQSFNAEELKTLLEASYSKLDILHAAAPKIAIKALCDKNQKSGRILIIGSLYLAGYILKEHS